MTLRLADFASALFVALALSAAGASLAFAADEPPAPAGAQWNFAAMLDGKPIGQHRFTVATTGDARKVTSEATFAVRIFGITAYTYRHVATEEWRGNCLESLVASTEDDGKSSKVRAAANGDALKIVTPTGTRALSGCVMSFAYWNPAIRDQSHLLNAQTGLYESVQVARVGDGTLEVRGRPVAATQFRIKPMVGEMQPIDVWYSAGGEWVGLDSTVAGGRKLSYRLQ